MTREEARRHMALWVYSLDDMPPKQVVEALTMAADALRPITREQVEEMWRGEWKESKDFDYGFWICSRCGFVSEASAAPKLYKFCPNCGCPLTDEAVQMVMERLEAMKDEAD